MENVKPHGARKLEATRIPEFASREEEAEWFDSHDMADFQGEFRTVRARFARNLSENLNIRLDPETLSRLRAEALSRGVGPTTLVRMWILENLRHTTPLSH